MTLSATTVQLIDELHEQQAVYRPSKAVSDQLADKTLIMLVGATCMGKGTVMQLVAQTQPDIDVVGTITTRPPRPDDVVRYTYYDQTNEGLQPLFDRIKQGELVQYVVNPYNKHIYASDIDDYPGEICIGDYFSTVVKPYKTYGFKQIIPITVVTDPTSWRRRFELRFPEGHADRLARLQEAQQSLDWSLAQTEEHFWAVNRDGDSKTAVQDILDALADKSDNAAEARALAQDCLTLIKQLQQGV